MKLDWQHVTIFAVSTAMVLGLVIVAAVTGSSTLWTTSAPVIALWGTTMAALLKGASESVNTAIAAATKRGTPPRTSPDNDTKDAP